jgi:hypothetical protein
MRQGFDQFCPDCVYASFLNTVYGKCYCVKFRTIVSRKRFPPPVITSQVPNTCSYFREKSP